MVDYAKNFSPASNKNYFTHVMKFGTMAKGNVEGRMLRYWYLPLAKWLAHKLKDFIDVNLRWVLWSVEFPDIANKCQGYVIFMITLDYLMFLFEFTNSLIK